MIGRILKHLEKGESAPSPSASRAPPQRPLPSLTLRSLASRSPLSGGEQGRVSPAFRRESLFQPIHSGNPFSQPARATTGDSAHRGAPPPTSDLPLFQSRPLAEPGV